MELDLAKHLLKICSDAQFTVGVAADVSGKQIYINDRASLPSASLIKLGIAAYGHTLWEQKASILLEEVDVTASHMVGGDGVIHLLMPKTYRIQDLLTLMLSLSDNTATNMLIKRFGMTNINDWLQVHFPGAVLQRELMATKADGDNLITADAAIKLLKFVLAVDDPYWQVIRRALRHQADQTKLTYPIATGEFDGSFMDKTGGLEGIEHDAARLIIGDQYADCVVLTQFRPGQRHAALLMQQQIGRVLCQHLSK